MALHHPRLIREHRTIAAMIAIYCRRVHGSAAEPCAACAELRDYAEHRLERCPFQESKPPCAKCPIHCYQPRIRAQVKEVMRYAGPRIFLRHPVFALRHWLDGFRSVPPHPRRVGRPTHRAEPEHEKPGPTPSGSRVP